jgi:hypothetical protein
MFHPYVNNTGNDSYMLRGSETYTESGYIM